MEIRRIEPTSGDAGATVSLAIHGRGFVDPVKVRFLEGAAKSYEDNKSINITKCPTTSGSRQIVLSIFIDFNAPSSSNVIEVKNGDGETTSNPKVVFKVKGSTSSG